MTLAQVMTRGDDVCRVVGTSKSTSSAVATTTDSQLGISDSMTPLFAAVYKNDVKTIMRLLLDFDFSRFNYFIRLKSAAKDLNLIDK